MAFALAAHGVRNHCGRAAIKASLLNGIVPIGALLAHFLIRLVARDKCCGLVGIDCEDSFRDEFALG